MAISKLHETLASDGKLEILVKGCSIATRAAAEGMPAGAAAGGAERNNRRSELLAMLRRASIAHSPSTAAAKSRIWNTEYGIQNRPPKAGEASGVESAHLSCHRLRITVLVGCALLRGGVGVPPAGGGCEPDHHGDHPAQRRALLDTSERSPAVPAKRRRLDRFGGAGARRPQWLRKGLDLPHGHVWWPCGKSGGSA